MGAIEEKSELFKEMSKEGSSTQYLLHTTSVLIVLMYLGGKYLMHLMEKQMITQHELDHSRENKKNKRE